MVFGIIMSEEGEGRAEEYLCILGRIRFLASFVIC